MDCSNECHDRFSSSDITLKKSRHGVRLLHIFEDLEENDFLLVREWEGKIGNERLHELCIEWRCSRMSFTCREGVIFFLETAFLEDKKFSIAEFLFCSLKSLYRVWKMYIANICVFESESFFSAYILWNLLWNLIDISAQ